MAENRLEMQQSQRLSQGLQTAIHLLSLDLTGLAAELQRAVQENPALEYVPPRKSLQDYAELVKTYYRGGRADARPSEAAAPRTQMADLEQQLRLSGLDAPTYRAALTLLHSLTSRGYMSQELDGFAAENNLSLQTAARALEAVQALEPAGIGARSVEECLELQLRARSDVDPLCYELIRLYLLDSFKGNLRQIARETGAALAHVRKCVDTIRGLSPAPCSLDEGAVHYITPEFSVEADADNQLAILFHNDYYPTLRRDGNFQRLADTMTGAEQDYARQMLVSADQLLRAVELRQTTMDKLARVIVNRQQAFFLGQYSLVPLRVDETADFIGVHETTVYRAIQGKYLYCARGTYPLDYFFQKEVSGGVSMARVKELIQELCQQDARLSDRAIAEALGQRGIRLSRRTVAKYRSQMDIHSSFRRGES